MKRKLSLIISLLFVLGLALPAAAGPSFPDEIPLPTDFQPEGIAVGPGHTFYAGSLADGTILAGDLRTGATEELVPGEPGRVSVGMSYDARGGNLFVAGGLGGVGRVYDAGSGALVAEYPMASGGDFGDFINDVIVTREAAYFTNSFAPYLYRVPLGPGGSLPEPAAVEAIALTGDWVQFPGNFVFNANGVVATANGGTLLVVNSAAEAVYRVDPATGEALEVDLGGPLPFGDRLVLAGRTLYVVQNMINQIAMVTLTPDLSAGVVGTPIVDPAFDVPTTAAAFGNSLYVVNARFGTPSPADYEIVRVSRR